jgi:predicted AlkP superfamily pyrophosphatase or phosphodiesterase
MKKILFYLILSLAIYLDSAQAANPIIVISIDGLRPDAIAKAKAKNLLQLIDGGISFSDARTVRPSITLPSHISMLTGLDPDQHGITWNQYRPDYGPVRHETALEIANKAGLHTAIFVAKDKLLHLNRPNSVDHFEKTEKEGLKVAQAFVRYVELHGVPDVTFLHLPDPDAKGHLFLWMSPFYLNGVEDADKALGIILSATKKALSGKRPTIIVTADHGGIGFGHMANVDFNNKIPFIVNGENVSAGLIKKERMRIYDTAAIILSLLNLPIPKHWMGKPIPLKI